MEDGTQVEVPTQHSQHGVVTVEELEVYTNLYPEKHIILLAVAMGVQGLRLAVEAVLLLYGLNLKLQV